MKKLVLIFGIIVGIICGGMIWLNTPSGEFDPKAFENGELIGYITMIIAFSTIFVAVKQYRDKYQNGVIKFGKAFMIGLYITLIGAVGYVVSWEIYFNNMAPDFAEKYVEFTKMQMAEAGMTAAEIETEMAGQMEFMEVYRDNALVRIGVTFLEIIPAGLFISLISALIFGVFLKKKPSDDVVVA
ncbi:MAG: DUF4199 domain-containing protein [Bacteroidota bacterium]